MCTSCIPRPSCLGLRHISSNTKHGGSEATPCQRPGQFEQTSCIYQPSARTGFIGVSTSQSRMHSNNSGSMVPSMGSWRGSWVHGMVSGRETIRSTSSTWVHNDVSPHCFLVDQEEGPTFCGLPLAQPWFFFGRVPGLPTQS